MVVGRLRLGSEIEGHHGPSSARAQAAVTLVVQAPPAEVTQLRACPDAAAYLAPACVRDCLLRTSTRDRSERPSPRGRARSWTRTSRCPYQAAALMAIYELLRAEALPPFRPA